MWWLKSVGYFNPFHFLTFPLNLGNGIPVSSLSLEEALFCLGSEKEAVLDKTEEQILFLVSGCINQNSHVVMRPAITPGGNEIAPSL